LKAIGVIGCSACLDGCSDATRKLIPFVNDPEDIIPGEATWYATTCRECPAGCGILAKNRDGRVIKVEGNPLHPVNMGKLCARGQASVQGVYNPDRHRGPFARRSDGSIATLSWDKAEKAVLEALVPALRKGNDRVVFLTDLTTGAEHEIVRRFLAATGSTSHIIYEPLAYEASRTANEKVFGIPAIPEYRIEKADFLISFGANFLETWVSNVEFARRFSLFREPTQNEKKSFVYVGPRLSLTGASADQWIAVPPGGESLVALCLLHILFTENRSQTIDGIDTTALRQVLSGYTPQSVADRTGVTTKTLETLAASFLRAKRPLVLAEGMGFEDPRAFDTALAAGLLNRLKPGSMDAIDFSVSSSLSRVARGQDMKKLTERIRGGGVDALFVLRANPVFHLPPQWGFSEALKQVPLIASLSSYPDETDRMAHFVLPSHTFLESWGDYGPRPGVRGLIQPVTGPLFNTRHAGDILLSLGRTLKGHGVFPEEDFYEVLRRGWDLSDQAWQEALAKGGSFGSEKASRPLKPKKPTFSPKSFNTPAPVTRNKDEFSFVSYPTIQFFDGRSANRPFLQELPDPLTCVTWGGWVEINPETAGRLGIRQGDILRLRTASGSIRAAAYPYPGISPGTFAMPIGHGRRAFGRYALDEMGNPLELTGGDIDQSGGIVRATPLLEITKEGGSFPLAHTDGSTSQHNRNIVRSLEWSEYRATVKHSPDIVLPLPDGFDEKEDFYPPHTHDAYRWIMIVDLDRCIGCAACVVACYAENNVSVVGKKNVLKGREMAWLHVQRYFEPSEPFVRFLPMLCQHCDEAPCEPVCPVFAPNHSKEGINNQVYNRCIGTRFCSQNCPYKVRRFNWFTWKHDPPLEWQLNPDVTARTKGVMEKCSFCIQRINEARIRARSENRLIRDGEFAPACAQTCPTDALVFGNLKDPHSRVARMAKDSRAYQVLKELNTKPGVIYLKKITRRPV
jgi:anaerobic selenocysteine-containing dehydrogenase/Fe-S-cluster-containing dehydrogenase component